MRYAVIIVATVPIMCIYVCAEVFQPGGDDRRREAMSQAMDLRVPSIRKWGKCKMKKSNRAYRFKLAGTIVLAAVLLFNLAGCSGSGDKDPKSDAAASDFNQEGLPIVNEPITLDVLTVRWGNMGDTFVQNQWLKDLEQSTNVKINWQVMSSNDWGEQKSIMLASGTLPDIVFGDIVFSDADIVNNLTYFRPLDDYIDQYMPNLKAAMEETPEMKQMSTFPDGKIYSLPARLPSRPQSSIQPIINKTWLDKLGLEVPDNTEELYQVFKAFKTQDPNGNGKPDELPVSGSGNISIDLLNPFGITDINGNSMMVIDNEPVYYPITENYKEAIKWAHKLYSEGLIDQEIFTQDNTMLTAKHQNPDVPLVGFSNQWVPDAVFGQWKDQYIAIPSIAGPDGKRYQGGEPLGMNLRRNEFLITTSNEYPEVSARWPISSTRMKRVFRISGGRSARLFRRMMTVRIR